MQNRKEKVIEVKEARAKLLKGVDFLADAVKLTLGPWGMNAVSGIRGGTPVITNDGVSIAKEIQSEDEIEDLGIRTAREVALQVNNEAGDGTTSALTFLQAALKEASKYLQTGNTFKGKMSPVAVKNKILEESKEIVEKLQEMAVDITTREELIDVARVSVEDEALAVLIGGTQFDLGKDGTIIPEESNNTEDSIERINGVRIDNGFGTILVMNNQQKQTLEVSNAKVILTNHTLQGSKALEPLSDILGQLAKMGTTDVVIVARAFSSEAIALCMENHKQGFRLYPVNAPYTDQTQVMLDLAAVVGGKFINVEDRNLESMQLSDVGFAEKLVAGRYNAVFTGSDNDEIQERVDARLEELEDTLDGAESPFERKLLQQRISQLKNGFALMKVTGNSEVERRYKFDKVEDAVNTVKSALQEGVLPGGGQALKTIGEGLPEDSLLKPACLSIYNQIMVNAGETIEIPEWVKDSVKVVRLVVEKGASVAAQLATAGIAINHKNERPMYVQETPKHD